ncbi:MAG: hypothetical protein GY856_42955 [bacterium]|nr:hypothetical protein [bacterium]
MPEPSLAAAEPLPAGVWPRVDDYLDEPNEVHHWERIDDERHEAFAGGAGPRRSAYHPRRAGGR